MSKPPAKKRAPLSTRQQIIALRKRYPEMPSTVIAARVDPKVTPTRVRQLLASLGLPSKPTWVATAQTRPSTH